MTLDLKKDFERTRPDDPTCKYFRFNCPDNIVQCSRRFGEPANTDHRLLFDIDNFDTISNEDLFKEILQEVASEARTQGQDDARY